MPNNQASGDADITGAGDGNRTRVISLEGWGSTIELLPLGRLTYLRYDELSDVVEEAGFEPA